MKDTLVSSCKIRFQDCDPFNHLNNSKYIDYYLNAREDQLLEHYHLNIQEHIQQTGNAWVVASHQIQYLKPVAAMEVVRIESQLLKYSENSLLVEMKMWNSAKTVLKSILWTKLVYFSIKTQKKVSHLPNEQALFSRIVCPVEEASFDQRTKHVLEQLKPVTS